MVMKLFHLKILISLNFENLCSRGIADVFCESEKKKVGMGSDVYEPVVFLNLVFAWDQTFMNQSSFQTRYVCNDHNFDTSLNNDLDLYSKSREWKSICY